MFTNSLVSLAETSEKFTWNTYLNPFNLNLWLSLYLGGVTLSSLSIWITHTRLIGEKKISLFESIWISAGAIFSVSVTDANNSVSSRSGKLSLFVTLLGGSLVYYSYSTCLLSSLLVPMENDPPFRNPQELLDTDYM